MLLEIVVENGIPAHGMQEDGQNDDDVDDGDDDDDDDDESESDNNDEDDVDIGEVEVDASNSDKCDDNRSSTALIRPWIEEDDEVSVLRAVATPS